MKSPAIFLDRDNTLIHNDGDLGDPAKVRLIQGAASAIASLQGLGYKIIVVSNQGGVARGVMTPQDVEAVNAKIAELVKITTGATIDRFYYCPYHPQGTVQEFKREHPWRKPQPGMILQATQDMPLDLDRSWMIGDQPRDVEAGAAAGLRTILLGTEADKGPDPANAGKPPDFVAANLIEAAKVVASQRTTTATGRVVQQRVWSATETPTERPPPPSRTKTAREQPQPRPTGHATHPEKKPIEPSRIETKKPDRVELSSRDKSSVKSDSTKGTADGPAPPPTPPAGAPQPDRDSRPTPTAPPPQPAAPPGSQPPADAAGRATHAGSQETTQAPIEPKELVIGVTTSGEMASLNEGPQQPPSPHGGVDKASGRSLHSIEQSLREILQELRNARAHGSDFSYVTVLAIVLQMIAGVCLLGALWLGAADPDAFLRWISVGVMMQLATLIALLMRG